MKPWIIYAFISMLFAGVTAVIAKKGLVGISGDLGIAVRTCFVFLFVLGFAAFTVPAKELGLLKGTGIAKLSPGATRSTSL